MRKKPPTNGAFPGGSRSRVTKAGNSFRNGNQTEEDLRVIDEWREAHSYVLNTFQALLRARTRGKEIYVAQRHKRLNTILDKLRRIEGMQLVRMDDVAGCRLIFRNVDELNKFRASMHKAKFMHKRRNEPDRYNYILKPKSSGYRGIHDVYEYNVKSAEGSPFAGLYVEIQYRTTIQHAWATANEVIGLITSNQPKFQRGDASVIRAMALASEILARAYEKSLGPLPEISDNRRLVDEFLRLNDEVNLLNTLKSTSPEKTPANHGSKQIFILNFSPNGNLDVLEFKNEIDAIRELFVIEKKHPENDTVLVGARSQEEVRSVFRNYFKDAQEFVALVESACLILSGATEAPKRILRLFKKEGRI